MVRNRQGVWYQFVYYSRRAKAFSNEPQTTVIRIQHLKLFIVSDRLRLMWIVILCSVLTVDDIYFDFDGILRHSCDVAKGLQLLLALCPAPVVNISVVL